MQSERLYELLCRRADRSEFVAEVTTSRAVLSGEAMIVLVILDGHAVETARFLAQGPSGGVMITCTCPMVTRYSVTEG